MQTTPGEFAQTLPRADEAEKILRTCVHCGFCNATCPTYQILGNELDGPRGRIYLIKQMIEGAPITRKTQEHLDRCLSCRNCETTCPSGVAYHSLLDIARDAIEPHIRRPVPEKLLRTALLKVIPHPVLFHVMLRAARALRPLLPDTLKDHVAVRITPARPRPAPRHARRMLMPEGCVQPSLSPNTNAAAARVLDRLGISIITAHGAGCCGATDYHLNAQHTGLERARRNIDAWWPAIEAGAQAIVITASGCGAFIKEYGYLLRDDPAYAAKAQRVSALARDLAEILANEPLETLQIANPGRIAFHCPCTLQHAQKLGGVVEGILQRLGFNLTTVPDAHLCCGSAGTYSITQPKLSGILRDRKIAALESDHPELIVTANIGCQAHLNSAGRAQVHHWIELVEAALVQQDD